MSENPQADSSLSAAPNDYRDGECLLNIPQFSAMQTVVAAAAKGENRENPQTDSALSAAANDYRDGECLLNIPQFSAMQTVVAAAAKGADKNQEAEIEPDFSTQKSGGDFYFLRLGVLLALAAIGGLYLLNQFFTAWALAQTFSSAGKYLLAIPLIICLLAAVFAIVIFVRAWLQLTAFRQLKLPENFTLVADGGSGKADKLRALKNQLREFLQRYPENDPVLKARGFSAETIADLRKYRRRLLDEESPSTDSWLQDFRDHFQVALDETARRKYGEHAHLTAAVVTASPIKLIDTLAVLAGSMRMLAAICQIYNLRADRLTLVALLGRVIFTAFISNIAQSTIENVDVGKEVCETVGSTVAGVPVIGGLFKGAVNKGVEYGVNYYFMRRLGKTAIRLLQPIRRD